MKQNVQGRQPVRIFEVGQHVLVKNHRGRMKWIPGEIVEKIAERTYVISIGNRNIKRHIDDIRAYGSVTERDRFRQLDENDDTWMYTDNGNLDDVINEPAPERNSSYNQAGPARNYPRRQRRPVDRYGMSNFV